MAKIKTIETASAEDARKRLAEIEQKEIEIAAKEYNEFINSWSAKHRMFIDNEFGLRTANGQPLRLTIRKSQ